MADPRDIYLDPGFSDRTAYGPPRPPEAAQPRSLLDMLRERTAREMESENMARLREFGAGMLASGSRNFFTNLAAGTRAQAEGERSRTDRLRQLAETERQQRATDIEEQRRRDEAQYREASLRQRREEAARANRPRFTELTDAQGNVVFIDPESGRRVSTDLRPARGQARPLSEADRATLRNRAETLANARVGIMQGVQPTAAQLEQARSLADDLFRVMLESAGALPAASTGNTQSAPATAPSRTLQYTPPRISSQPQQ